MRFYIIINHNLISQMQNTKLASIKLACKPPILRYLKCVSSYTKVLGYKRRRPEAGEPSQTNYKLHQKLFSQSSETFPFLALKSIPIKENNLLSTKIKSKQNLIESQKTTSIVNFRESSLAASKDSALSRSFLW